MMQSPIWQTEIGEGPLVACAIHDGHAVRPEVAECLKLDSVQRLYEEDPYTGAWTAIAPTRIIGRQSRFEVDLNRPRQRHDATRGGRRGACRRRKQVQPC